MFLVLYYFISPIIIIIAVRQMEPPTKSHEPLDDECDEEVDYDVELYEEYASFLRQNHTGSNHPYDLMALYHMFIAMKRDEIEAEVRKNESESAVNNVGASGVVVGDDRETESADPPASHENDDNGSSESQFSVGMKYSVGPVPDYDTCSCKNEASNLQEPKYAIIR